MRVRLHVFQGISPSALSPHSLLLWTPFISSRLGSVTVFQIEFGDLNTFVGATRERSRGTLQLPCVLGLITLIRESINVPPPGFVLSLFASSTRRQMRGGTARTRK